MKQVFDFLKSVVRFAIFALGVLSVPAGMTYIGMQLFEDSSWRGLFPFLGTGLFAWLLVKMMEERKKTLRDGFRRLFEEYQNKAQEESNNEFSFASMDFVRKIDELIDGK